MIEESTQTRREQILTTATRMFASRGYKATSLRDLAGELGIEAPSLYSYINGKEDLLQEIILPIAQQFTTAMGEVQKMATSPVERLQQMISQHIQIILKDIDASSVLWSEHRQLTGEVREKFYEMRDHYETGFISIISEGVESCVFEIEDVRITSMMMLTALNNIWHWYDPAYTSSEDLVRQITHTFMNGIKSTTH